MVLLKETRASMRGVATFGEACGAGAVPRRGLDRGRATRTYHGVSGDGKPPALPSGSHHATRTVSALTGCLSDTQADWRDYDQRRVIPAVPQSTYIGSSLATARCE